MVHWDSMTMGFIYQIYGLAFFVLGLVVCLLPKQDVMLRFIPHLWLMGMFGMLHGTVEFIELQRLYHPDEWLAWWGRLILVASYLPLLEFGRRTCASLSDPIRLPAPWVYGIAGLGVGVMELSSTEPFVGLAAGARFFVGAPGALLSGLALFASLQAQPKSITTSQLAAWVRIVALAFMGYSILTIFLTKGDPNLPSWLPVQADFLALFGVPVQLMRAVCAVAATLGFIAVAHRIGNDIYVDACAFASQEAVFIADANTVILRVNEAFTKSTGYKPKEVTGQKIELSQSGCHDGAFYAFVWECVKLKGTWQGEIWDRRKNGEIYPKWLTLTVVKNKKGMTTHYIGTHTDITQRKQADYALRESEARFHALVEQSMAGIYIIDDDHFSYVNPHFAAIFGYDSPEDLIWRIPYTDLVSPEDRGLVAENVRRRIEGETKEMHYSFAGLRRDDCLIDVEVFGRAFGYQGRTSIIGLLIDITDRRAAEDSLRNSEKRFHDIAKISADWIWEVDAEWRYIYASNSLHNMLGYWPEEILGKTPFDLMPPAEAERMGTLFAGIRARRETFCELGNFNCHKDGSLRLVQTNGTPVLDVDGKLLGYRGLDRDITEKRQAEDRLMASEERLQLALEATSDGLWDWNLSNGLAYLSPRYYEMTGYRSDEFTPDFAFFQRTVHPDDWTNVQESMDDYLQGRRQSSEIDYRMVNPAGEVKWVRGRGKVVEWDAAGAPLRIVGTISDISAQVVAETTLRTRERYHRAVLDNFPFMVWLKDTDCRFLAINKALAKVANVADPDEMLGKTDYDYWEPELAEHYRADDQDVLECGRPKIVEEEITQTGRRFWIQTYKSPVELDGRIIGTVGFSRDITERKQAVQALQRESEKNLALLRNASDGIHILDADGKIIEASDSFCASLGYSREEAMGMDMSQWVAGLTQAELINDFRSRFEQTGHVLFEVIHRHKDGTLFDAEISSFRLDLDGKPVMFCSARDITARKQVEEQLRELAQAVEQSAESIAITDLDAVIKYVNEAFVQNSGYSREELIGQNSRMLKSDKTPLVTYQDMWHTLGERQTWKGAFINRRKDGSEYIEFAIISPLHQPDGRITNYVAVKEDITEKKRLGEELDRYRNHLEEKVAQRTSELEITKTQAEAATRSKSVFLANMSHEIRTPMNAIMGMTELCLRTDLSERQRNYLIKIRSASDSLLHIIDDILDFSKIEAGKLDMLEEPFALPDVLDNMVLILAQKARDKGLELATQISPAIVNRAFLGDSYRLGQVLINLLGNAIKFSRQGQVLVNVNEDALEEGMATLHFTVRDEGIGLSAEQQTRLFQSFSQADTSTTRNYGGTGLGLAISQRLVWMMGGKIWVDSTLGRGSTFHFTVKLACTERIPTQTTCHHSVSAETLARLRGMDILLVEDAEINQEVIRDLLEQAGMKVRLAVNGKEALREVEKALPDCVLMDCQMPVMDGFEATRRFRAQERYRNLPIIALTANAMFGDREKCLLTGMNCFVAKPVDFGELFVALAQWVRPRQEAVAATQDLSSDAVVQEALAERTIPLELPGIDTVLGLALVGGRMSSYVRLLKKFRDSRASGFEEQFRQAQVLRDWEEATRLAHTLKGIVRTLGAESLGDLADRVEQAARQGQPELVAETLEALEEELQRVLAGLAQLRQDEAETTAPVPLLDPEGLGLLIYNLGLLLEEQDTAAVDSVAILERALAGGGWQVEAQAIGQSVSRYDFTEARERLRHLVTMLQIPNDSNQP